MTTNPSSDVASRVSGRLQNLPSVSSNRFACVMALLACSLGLPSASLAVYAPIPEQEQGKAFVVTARASAAFDSNIFGAATDEIDSAVFTFAPKGTFNASLTDQTFVSAYYQLTLDHFTDRPGDKTLDSHELFGRVAHSFSAVTSIDVYDFFQSSRNPESLLAGIPINTDQSFQRNQLDFRAVTAPTQKSSATLKYRNTLFDYRNAMLGRSLDRTENLYGVAGSYDVLPETKAVLEYRRQEIDYRHSGGNKDKTSDFVLGGADYRAAEKLTVSARLGVEWRHRDSEQSTTAPSAEFTAKYDYSRQSFISAGYAFSIDETSNVDLYNDGRINRFFVNVQHSVTAKIAASASLSYEPGVLQGRRGIANVDETTVRGGLGLSYLPNINWTVSATYDYDDVSSDDPAREMTRHRVGVTVQYAF